MKVLVIVESPHKVEKIKNILNSQKDGNSYVVAATVGHILDLNKDKTLGVDISNNYRPDYVEHPNKTDVIKNLKRLRAHCAQVWIASDLDQEGEFIGFSICKILGLPVSTTPRIVFNEITKTAILRAIKNPKNLDYNLLDAQKTRRITDRLVGFLITRAAKSINDKLTVGRVQTMMVKIIVDREMEMQNFNSTLSYHTTGFFNLPRNFNENKKRRVKVDAYGTIESKLNKSFKNEKDAREFLEACRKSKFLIGDLSDRIAKKSPPPPLITSTLQSLVSRGLGISPKRVLDIAQKLYQNGLISYPRTDCPKLPEEKMDECQTYILNNYDKSYYKRRVFKSNDESAQEAHACIYPTKISMSELGLSMTKKKQKESRNTKNDSDDDEEEIIGFTEAEKKVYRYIWLYTVSSQMSPSETKVTKAKIIMTNRDEYFTAEHQQLVFEGYSILWGKTAVEEEDEKSDDSTKGSDERQDKNSALLVLEEGDELDPESIQSKQKASQGPSPYTESSLMTQLKKFGIGRPSTRGQILNDIMSDRKQFIYKGSKPGEKLNIHIMNYSPRANEGELSERNLKVTQNAYHNRLYSTEMGRAIIDFVDNYFQETFNYNFTKQLEIKMESIENGKVEWNRVVDELYQQFAPKLDQFPRWGNKNAPNPARKEKRKIGTHKGQDCLVYLAKYGPVIQIGGDEEFDQEQANAIGQIRKRRKPTYVSLPKEYNLDTVTYDDIKTLLDFPYKLDKLKDGRNLYLKNSKFGMYLDTGANISQKGKTYQVTTEMFDEKLYDETKPLESQIDCLSMDNINRIIAETDKPKDVLREVQDIKIVKGKFGPYFIFNDVLVGIPKFHNVDLLTYDELLDLYRIKLKKSGRTYGKKRFKKDGTTSQPTKGKVKINFKKKF